MGEHVSPGKPFEISKQEVWQAYQKVAANKGAAGVDGVGLAEFESDLKGNLYKIWNRMSSGSYFPPPVKAVEIPKAHGAGTRMLGIPTIGDRIAQTVVAARLEAAVEPKFHPDSYGYRPRKGALDAVGKCRERCWRYDWVIDLDVQKFFDTVPWDRIIAAVEANTALPWVILYVKRWLAAPIRMPDGTLAARDRGTPQGSAVSPVLANLFMHYAFDLWMAREFPAAHLSAMPMTRWCTAGPWPRLGRAGHAAEADGAGRRAACTRTRPGSCTARTGRGVARMSTRNSPSSASLSGPGGCGPGTGTCSPGSSRRPARTPSRR